MTIVQQAYESTAAAIAIARAIGREAQGQFMVLGKNDPRGEHRDVTDATSKALVPLAKEFFFSRKVLGVHYPHANPASAIQLVDWILCKGMQDDQQAIAQKLYIEKYGHLPDPGAPTTDVVGTCMELFNLWLDALSRSPALARLKERAERVI